MTDPQEPSANVRRRPLAITIAILMMLAGGILWAWHGPGAAMIAPAPAFAIERQADRSWPAMPGDAPGLSWHLNISARDSRVQSNSNQSVSNAGSARFAGRSIAVLNMSEGPLADLVARGLILKLQANPQLQRISYCPANEGLPAHEVAPDLVLRLTVSDNEEDTFATDGFQRVSARAVLSDQLERGLNDVISAAMAPHHVHIRLEASAAAIIEQRGIATPNVRLQATAQDLSNSLAEKLQATFAELHESHGEFPELPTSFYPEFRAIDPQRFDVAMVFQSHEPHRQLASWRARFVHNETWWHGTVQADTAAAIERITARLLQAGFVRKNQDSDYDHTFEQGLLQIELIPAERQWRHNRSNSSPPPTCDLYVRYLETADPKLREQELDRLISPDTSTTLMLMSTSAWSQGQRQRCLSIVNARDLQDPQDLIARAQLRHAEADAAGAAEDLARAACYANTSFTGKPAYQAAIKAAKKLERNLDDKLSNRDWLLAAGLTELRADQNPVERQVTIAAPARFLIIDQQRITMVAAGLKRNADGQWRGALRCVGAFDSEQSNIASGQVRQNLGTLTVGAQFVDDPSTGSCRVRMQVH